MLVVVGICACTTDVAIAIDNATLHWSLMSLPSSAAPWMSAAGDLLLSVLPRPAALLPARYARFGNDRIVQRTDAFDVALRGIARTHPSRLGALDVGACRAAPRDHVAGIERHDVRRKRQQLEDVV